jgi:lipoprotein-releasing system permease protein
MRNWQQTLSVAKEEDGVVAAAPFVMAWGLLMRGEWGGDFATDGRPAQIVGMEADATDTVTAVRDYIKYGVFDLHSEPGEPLAMVMGDGLALRLQAHLGDTITAVAVGSYPFNPVLGYRTFVPFTGVIVGIFHTGLYDYDDAFMYVELGAAQQMASLGNEVSGIEARTANRWDAPKIAASLSDKLDAASYYVEDWQSQNKSLFSALKLEKLAMTIIVFLIVLVASFNIVSVLSMLVNDKTREIGILRAMGITATGIRRIFLLQGVFIGFVGTSIGLAVGLAISVAVGRYKLIELDPATYFIDYLPVRTEPLDILLIVAGSMLIAILATLSPSAQAARKYPLEAIRHE